ncbi:MAG: hypothetical protein ABW171_03590 [Steroidobacter sp.]
MRDRGARNTFFCAVLLTLAGCSKAPEPARPSAQPAALPPGAAAPEETTTDTEPPAESGLAIKRGIATLAADHNSFRPCGEQVDLWMVDQSEGLLTRTFAGEKASDGAPLKLYVEAYGERSTTAEDLPANATGYAGVFVMEEALYAALDGQTRGCDNPMQDYIVAARGSEPFWNAEVTETALIWRQPDEPKEISLPAPQTQDSEGAVGYTAAGNNHQVELMIEAQACRDSTSGEYFAYAARATFDGKQFAGCARVGK